MGYGIWDWDKGLGWDFGKWDGINGIGIGIWGDILPIPLIRAASIAGIIGLARISSYKVSSIWSIFLVIR